MKQSEKLPKDLVVAYQNGGVDFLQILHEYEDYKVEIDVSNTLNFKNFEILTAGGFISDKKCSGSLYLSNEKEGEYTLRIYFAVRKQGLCCECIFSRHEDIIDQFEYFDASLTGNPIFDKAIATTDFCISLRTNGEYWEGSAYIEGLCISTPAAGEKTWLVLGTNGTSQNYAYRVVKRFYGSNGITDAVERVDFEKAQKFFYENQIFMRPRIKGIYDCLIATFGGDFEFVGETFYSNRVFARQNGYEESVILKKPTQGSIYLYAVVTSNDRGFPQFAIFRGKKPYPSEPIFMGIMEVDDDFVKKYLS